MKLRMLFVLACSYPVVGVVAQVKIFGTLKNKISGEGIPYTNIRVKNTLTGTSSNEDGFFELYVDKKFLTDSILISHLEFDSKTLPLSNLDMAGSNTIELEPAVILLDVVSVKAKETYEYFLESIAKTRSRQVYPGSAKFYYRELVKDNNQYSKYSDAILTANFPKDKDKMEIFVDESRVVNLPRDDDIADISTPLEVKKLFGYQYLDLLNRFQGEKKQLYDYSILTHVGEADKVTYLIKPKKCPDKNIVQYYNAWITTQDDLITDIEIKQDTSCNWQMSLLGFTIKFKSYALKASFYQSNENIVLGQGLVQFRMDISHKKLAQIIDYQSVFLAVGTHQDQLAEVEKSKRLKSKSLYKVGSAYSHEFWKEYNIPILTDNEGKLLAELIEQYGKIKEKK